MLLCTTSIVNTVTLISDIYSTTDIISTTGIMTFTEPTIGVPNNSKLASYILLITSAMYLQIIPS